MWDDIDDDDDDFYRFFRNHNPFSYNRSHTFDLDKFFNNTYPSPFTPFKDEYKTPSKFKATKYVTITVSEGDNEGIDKPLNLTEKNLKISLIKISRKKTFEGVLNGFLS